MRSRFEDVTESWSKFVKGAEQPDISEVWRDIFEILFKRFSNFIAAILKAMHQFVTSSTKPLYEVYTNIVLC